MEMFQFRWHDENGLPVFKVIDLPDGGNDNACRPLEPDASECESSCENFSTSITSESI